MASALRVLLRVRPIDLERRGTRPSLNEANGSELLWVHGSSVTHEHHVRRVQLPLLLKEILELWTAKADSIRHEQGLNCRR